VVLASALAAGSLGSTVALWREKTFQALAMTALVLVLWLVGWEIVAARGLGTSWGGISTRTWATAMSPWQAVLAAAEPSFRGAGQSGIAVDPVQVFLLVAVGVSALLNVVAVAMVRVWNPTRELLTKQHLERDEDSSPADVTSASSQRVIQIHGAGGKARPVWDNPILWREIRTWAFGKKILLIRLAYLAVFVACAAAVAAAASGGNAATTEPTIPSAAMPLVALLVVGLILLNALSVTSITNERDSRALDLLLVTDLSPKEIVFGKLGGAFYNAKEMIALPIALCAYLWFVGQLTAENFLFLVGGLAVLSAFAATLGLHAGITYSNSRTAIATSIGTLLFLFLGIATCMKIMLAFTDSFEYQFGTFFGAIAGGSLAMYVALGWRNPSQALGWASGLTPFVTFYIITSFLLGQYGTVFLVTVLTYGFATAAMLVPAIYVFDVATGRTTVQEE
jgi:ABC-type transport system involved in multi-copper enzyme maturation permease subunit